MEDIPLSEWLIQVLYALTKASLFSSFLFNYILTITFPKASVDLQFIDPLSFSNQPFSFISLSIHLSYHNPTLQYSLPNILNCFAQLFFSHTSLPSSLRLQLSARENPTLGECCHIFMTVNLNPHTAEKYVYVI